MFPNTIRLWFTEHLWRCRSMCLRQCLSLRLVSTSERVSPLAPRLAAVGEEASVGDGILGMWDGVVGVAMSFITTTLISTELSLTGPRTTTTIPGDRAMMAIILAPIRIMVRMAHTTRTVITVRTVPFTTMFLARI